MSREVLIGTSVGVMCFTMIQLDHARSVFGRFLGL